MGQVSRKYAFPVLVCFSSSLLSGCFELGDPIGTDPDAQSANQPADPPPSTTNAPPVISGNPRGSATVGQAYLFVPNASDADNDVLTFDIDNLPRWASFNSTTGQLEGTPQLGDSAVYNNIVISVDDGQTKMSLPPFAINVTQIAMSSATLTWTAPTQNEDGTPLTDLAAYKIYYGLSEGNYPNQIRLDNPGLTTYVVDNLTPNTYFFVSTSINANGMESDFSNVATMSVN